MHTIRILELAAGSTWTAAAVAQPVAPWLKVERMADDVPHTTVLGSARFSGAGPVRWTVEDNEHGIIRSYWQPEWDTESLPLTATPMWNTALGEPTQMRIEGVTDAGTAYGEISAPGPGMYLYATAWIQEAGAGASVRSLGLTEPRHFGADGAYNSGVVGFTAGEDLLGGTLVQQPAHADDGVHDLWVRHAGEDALHPILLQENGRPLQVSSTVIGPGGPWAGINAARRLSRGARGWILNTATLEQRLVGLFDADHTVDADDELDGIPLGCQSTTVLRLDAKGNAMLLTTVFAPGAVRFENWVYSWERDSYTLVERVPEGIVSSFFSSPDDAGYVVEHQPFNYSQPLQIDFSPGAGQPLQPVNYPAYDSMCPDTRLVTARWNGSEPSVVFGKLKVDRDDWRWMTLFRWSPSQGATMLYIPGVPQQPRCTPVKSFDGRYLLLDANPFTPAPGVSRFGALDTATNEVVPLPASDSDDISDLTQIAGTFVRGQEAALIVSSADNRAVATLRQIGGEATDLSVQLNASLAEAGIRTIVSQDKAVLGRVMVAITDDSGHAGLATLTPVFRCSAADISGVGGATDGPDQALDNNDFIRFVTLFFAADPRADFGSAGGLPGADGAFDNNDFIAFITAFFADCSS